MLEALVIGKIILVMIGTTVQGYAEGVGAYYAPGLMQQVCEHRVAQGWQDLDCSEACLVAGIEHNSLGQRWLVDLPGGSMHECLVVDVGAEIDLPDLRARGEVVELSWAMARQAGWQTYMPNVRIWRLGDDY